MKTKNQQAVDKLRDQGFIAKTRQTGVYVHGELGIKVRDNLIDFWRKCYKMDIPELLGLDIKEEDEINEELQEEDEINEELQEESADDDNIEELDGLKIHVDAHGNSQHYVDLYARDVETKTEYSVLELIAERGTFTMDELTKLTVKEVEDLIQNFSIRAPVTNNELGKPYRKSPYYKATISLELEAAKSLFRFEESEVKEFVYRVNDVVESYPGNLKVQSLRIQIYKQNFELVSFQEAINEGIVSKAVACLIGKVYKFFELIGICEEVRFKEQRARDAECWVAEVKCAGGWIECTKINLLEAEPDPIEDLELLEAEPDPIEDATRVGALMAAFKNNYRSVDDALKRMSQEEAREMMADLESKGEYKLHLERLQMDATIKPNMVRMKTKNKAVSVSFMIGSVICCLYEHSFDTRPDQDGNLLGVFRFPPFVAPYICFIITNNTYKSVIDPITKFLEEAAISCKVVTQGPGIAKRLIISDECGCLYAIFVASKSLVIRERDSNDAINVEFNDVGQLIKDLLNGECTWQDTYKKYTPGNLSI